MDHELQINRVDNAQLSHKTRDALIEIIRENARDDKPFKLPNEDMLSQRLGVSRNVLRDALMSLEEMGIVTRRRSKGTIANPAIANTAGRMDVHPELFLMLREMGYTPRVETKRFGFVYENDPELGEEDNYLNVEKLFLADEKPVAFCMDHIAGSYAGRGKEYISVLKDCSHYKFLELYCQTTMAYTMARVDVLLAEPWLARILKVAENEPVIFMEDHGYNFDHEIVIHSYIYFRRDTISIRFLRKNW